jgi:hypothetical protein
MPKVQLGEIVKIVMFIKPPMVEIHGKKSFMLMKALALEN